jgi:diacylglycerol kinase (ATP)
MENNWKPAILVNLTANNHQASTRWARIGSEVMRRFPVGTPVIVFNKVDEFSDAMELLLSSGYTCFITAGGDGTIHYLVNYLLNYSKTGTRRFSVGHIGLGSSNDYLKPFSTKIQGIPVRLSMDNMQAHDIGKVTFLNEYNQPTCRYFIVNASLGITAEANWLFNQPNYLIQIAKRNWVSLAIVYAAMRTIFTYTNRTLCIGYDNELYSGAVSNVAILKSPYVSGSFHYDQCIGIADGRLGLNICGNLTRPQLLRVLIDLSRGKFSSGKQQVSAYTSQIKIVTQQHIPLETDGEVTLAKNPVFSVIPSAIYTLSP